MRILILPLLAISAPLLAASPTPTDTLAVSRALNDILETAKTGSRSRWQGSGGRSGFVTIQRTWFADKDTPCREYLRTIKGSAGSPTRLHGTGCRDSNGNWMLLETRECAAEPARNDCKSAPAPISRPAKTKKKSAKKPARKKTVSNKAKAVSKPAVPATPKPAAPPPDPAAAAVRNASQPNAADW